ncbi:phosphomannose isomerase [Neocallimastix californiae]|uniref:Mannose-6-phosphate isomerase n=1 Tax=Neocallimastix californiae TaxID=1754190 RepID=A0A1Y2D2E6_9FUNG|nr:phosphomannose isomerase [Neocallimastix californiae]|eukprot:ORY52745.1 phosphomannose isomerase [Neocallimastix californiae]
MSDRIFQLIPKAQNYAWGKLGSQSKVAELVANAYQEIRIDNNKTYAELWMGTHPNAPSLKKSTGENLKDIVSSNPDLLTIGIAAKYHGDLPFLFKVLSIQKALSIQAHPDKKLAEQLYKKYPNIYKDDNHKPEMAIALTPFEGLCGFRPLQDIKKNLNKFPEIVEAIGKDKVADFIETIGDSNTTNTKTKKSLKKLYKSLMEQDQEIIRTQINNLISRIKQEDPNPAKGTLNEVLVRIEAQYPGDVGVFSIILLNYVSLKEGEGLYLAADEPHAYISGDCIECMATSDNVVRAGLTPKFKDVDTLVNMLTYTCKSADNQIVSGIPYLQSTTTVLYNPPIEEFSILCTTLSPVTRQRESFHGIKGPSIIIVTEGNGRIIYKNNTFEACKGSIFFIGANTPITLEANNDQTTFYRAYTELLKPHL